MKPDAFDFSTIDLLHERLCLDFVNTTSNHSHEAGDHLRTYADLMSWSQYVGLIDGEAAQSLLDSAARQPADAEAVIGWAVEIREALYAILSAYANGESPDVSALDTFNNAVTNATAHMRIVPVENGFEWDWTASEDRLDRMLGPVVWSAVDLLLSDDRRFLRKCDGCDWLFLDTSRNHSRRWCDMKTCGNRAKARRHYARARTGDDEV